MKEIVKISCILIYGCMGEFLSCSRPYQNMGGYKIYKLKSAPDFADGGPITISALVIRDTIEYGSQIEIKATFVNVSKDTIKVLPKATTYLMHKGFETYTEPKILFLNSQTDIRKTKILSPGDTVSLSYTIGDYKDFFAKPEIYTVELIYVNSIYQIDNVKLIAGKFRSNQLDVRFK